MRKNTWCEKKRIGLGSASHDTVFFHTMYFPYQVANLLCNEFITSKTFLVDHVNNKTFVNRKTFVGRLNAFGGKT